MQSDRPKVLHCIGGAPLFAHALASGDALEPVTRILVVGHGGDLVRAAAAALDPAIKVVQQAEQLGTAHAVDCARAALAGASGTVFVLFGDTPFIQPETLARMAEARRDHAVVVLGFQTGDPGRYGRLVMDGASLERIVEFKDASPEERAITLCNGGIFAVDAETLFDLLDGVGNDNAAGEFYLTDIVAVARARGLTVTAVTCPEAETVGINTRAELARGEALFQAAKRAEALDNGVTLIAPETVFFSHDTHIGRDATVEPNVVFGPGVTVETEAVIRAFSHLEGCHVGARAVVGPFARLRPGTELSNGVKIGNFVEIKNALIGDDARVNHLSYVGDAHIGENANIGAGTITCNFDGVFKHRTVIGAGAFIGSSTMLVAPVTVGAGAMTASGSVITSHVPDGALAFGRAPQKNKPDGATKKFAEIKARKANMKKDPA